MAQDNFFLVFSFFFSSRKYQIFWNIALVHWNGKLHFLTFPFCFKNKRVVFIYLYIIFINPLLSFDLAFLCKFSSNTSGTALGRIGRWESKEPNAMTKSNAELWNRSKSFLWLQWCFVDRKVEQNQEEEVQSKVLPPGCPVERRNLFPCSHYAESYLSGYFY